MRLEAKELASLIETLRRDGYEVVGPTVRDGAIVYDAIEGLEDLPRGWTDEHAPGRYRLLRRPDNALFGYVVGPQSWKRFLLPPRVRLFSVRRNGDQPEIIADASAEPPPKYAFLGARACELAALAVQDRVLLGGPYADPIYRNRRQDVFVIAVQCTQAAPTCFCSSMGTGPKLSGGYDIALTEVVEGAESWFVAHAGTEAGAARLAALGAPEASPQDVARAEEAARRAESMITRRLNTAGLRERLAENFEHPQWDDVARRCLACANCTLVCPTCFCVTVEDTSDVTGSHAERWRLWDSCFTQSFSYIHGGPVRASIKARYRQWLTHKLSSWHDQFGTSGCVGCGRCITWCPAAIEITTEAEAVCGFPPSSLRSEQA
ncbi:MAG: 4Fe-4S dicluster domain-containing protein [Bryobacterales bacterium]|nr:4Fe-4S dicluster domain-containing protein [Bryobacteraceae bacterium]MDW8353713.1 4Fe-4S dicluster domain-containing protein [Bryobacterales bacterium]